MKIIVATVLLLMTVISPNSYAEKITGVTNPYLPFKGPDLPGQGIMVEIVRAAFETQGYELAIKFMPWARAISGVRASKYDVLLAVWWTEKRTETLKYSDMYLQNQIKFIKRTDDDFEYEGLESLTGKNVGVIRDYAYSEEFLNATNFKRTKTSDLLNNLRKVAAGRLDYTVEDELVARTKIAAEAPELKSELTYTKNALSTNDLHVTSALNNAKSTKLIAAFNEGLKTIKRDGTYASILAKHDMD